MKRLTFLAFLLLLVGASVTGQNMPIEGPACVLSGSEYQYNIKGNLPSGAQLCVTGGKISGSNNSCITDLNAGFVRITWSGTKGAIAFTSAQGNYSLNISITEPLQGGSVTNGKQQSISYNASSSSVSCSKPIGGGCNASYSFQWQQSLDNLNWQDIAGATAQNLASISSLTQTSFYRRKTTETSSGTTVYSDVAVVYVGANTKGH